MHRHHVSVLQQVGKRDALRAAQTKFFGTQKRVVCDHLHVKGCGQSSHPAAHMAKTHNAQGRTGDFLPHEIFTHKIPV